MKEHGEATPSMLRKLKRAMASFGLMSIVITHSIQNCHLIYLQDLKVRQQTEQELLANSRDYSKQETTFVYLWSIMFSCAYDASQRHLPG